MKPGSRVSFGPITFRGVDAQSGTLRVPVRHAEPDGPSLDLRLVRLAGTPDGVPLVFLTGGPGLSGIRAGEGRLFPMFDALRAHGDVILLDQRACVAAETVPRSPAPAFPAGHPASRDDYLRIIRETVRDGVHILARRGIPIDALNTNESADDVSMLVRALYGDDAVASLLGWSYGSHLAMAIMKRHEALVARAVLAAPEGPDHTYKMPHAIETHLERLSERAQIDIVASMSRVLAGAIPRTWSRFDLEWIFSEGVTDTRVVQKLPAALARMERGDFAIIEEDRLLRGAWRALRDELPFGVVRYAMDCASGATGARLALIAREARETLLGNTVDFPTPDVCDAVGCPDLGDDFRSPPRCETPTLFITGTLDCRTPAENVADLAPGLPHHTHVVVEDAGHGDLLLPSGVQAAIVRFIGGEPVQGHIKTDTPFAFDAT